MLLFLVIVMYVLANAYIVHRVLRWASCFNWRNLYRIFKIVFIAGYGLVASTMVIAFCLPSGSFHRQLQKFANCWEGMFIYLLLFAACTDLIRFIMKKIGALKEQHLTNPAVLLIIGAMVVGITAGTSFYGFAHANEVTEKNYDIEVDKVCKDKEFMRVALIADLHLGYSIDENELAQVVDIVNRKKVDLIVLAGDIFDNNYDSLSDPKKLSSMLASMKSQYGTYAVWGNHDVTERLFSGFSVASRTSVKRSGKMDDFLKESNVKVLNDETTLVHDAFYLVGRLDYEKAGDGTNHRKKLSTLLEGVDKSKPVFLIDHEPRKLGEVAKQNVDVMFSGHTHNGQFFPLNLGCKLAWENSTGCKKIDQMYSIVTSGVGVYGPDMRVGTDADVSIVDIAFNDANEN